MNEVKQFFIDAFHHLGSNRGVPGIDVRFYPYAGLRHTIRVRSGHVYVRLSDIAKDCSPEAMRALAFVLVARLLGKKVPEVHERIYRDYSLTPEVMRSSDIARRRRGRKMVSSALGNVYDLEKMFAKLNRRYFDSNLEKPTITWSQRKRAASSAITIGFTRQSRLASRLTRLKCPSGLLNTSFITKCFT